MFGMCSGAVFRSCKADCARWMQAEKKKEQLDSFKETSVSHCVPLCPTVFNSFQGWNHWNHFANRGSGSCFQRFIGGRLCLTLAVE